MTPLTSFTLNNNLIYGERELNADMSAEFHDLRRIFYFPDTDVMYLLVATRKAVATKQKSGKKWALTWPG
ncbi:MAG: hypothetical protein HC896_06880 [Bacteroidales bacterium]|nr:hypothetical protein [Bacteroidales bacterium]